MKITENMQWPPMDMLAWKMREHSAWFSGSSEVLANFYMEYEATQIMGLTRDVAQDTFWGRQLSNQGDTFLHVPIANDLSETSSNLLFSESPLVRFKDQADKTKQELLDALLIGCGLFPKLLEGAEVCSGIGGVYVKIAWDSELSEYPIPVIVQADKAIPTFQFGILKDVTFWTTIRPEENNNGKIYRLLEKYEKGQISYELYLGTPDRLGYKVDFNSIEETSGMEETIETPDILLAFYIPNMLPNRLDRNSCLGRSDYSGIEGLMDALDETYTAWMKDIAYAKAKVLIPESYLRDVAGQKSFDVDKSMYLKLNIDPLTEGDKITPQQFAIRAEEFEKTVINLIERIVVSAGFSPQSFGLNIEGRAESGTALNVRERKSFQSRGKKENYWGPAVKKIVEAIILVYSEIMGGKLDPAEINVTFSDGVTNDLTEKATSIKMLNEAQAVSVETKVRMLNPDWEEERVKAEVKMIIDENGLMALQDPLKVGADDEDLPE